MRYSSITLNPRVAAGTRHGQYDNSRRSRDQKPKYRIAEPHHSITQPINQIDILTQSPSTNHRKNMYVLPDTWSFHSRTFILFFFAAMGHCMRFLECV